MNDKESLAKRERQKVLLRVELRAAIACASDEQAEQSRPRLLAERLTNTDLDKSQIRNLENLAYTTNKVSDITDLLKKLIGRDSKERRWAKENAGQDVIAALEALRADADRIVKGISEHAQGEIDPDLARRVHLELCREFIKHLAAEFMFHKREA
jgi:hypothetical protein